MAEIELVKNADGVYELPPDHIAEYHAALLRAINDHVYQDVLQDCGSEEAELFLAFLRTMDGPTTAESMEEREKFLREMRLRAYVTAGMTVRPPADFSVINVMRP